VIVAVQGVKCEIYCQVNCD